MARETKTFSFLDWLIILLSTSKYYLAIIFLDAIHYKIRDEDTRKVVSKAAYTCLAIDAEGHKDLLGLWVSETEGANFWLTVLTELKNRGVEDIFIACIDGLKGFPEAINSVFPKTEIQLCVIHQIRNTLRYIASKDQKEFMKDFSQNPFGRSRFIRHLLKTKLY